MAVKSPISPVSPVSHRSSSIGLALFPETGDLPRLPAPADDPPRLELGSEQRRSNSPQRQHSFLEVLTMIKELQEHLCEIYNADVAQLSSKMSDEPLPLTSRSSSGPSLARDRTWSLYATTATTREKMPGLRSPRGRKRAVSTPGPSASVKAPSQFHVDARFSSKESKAWSVSELANQAIMAKNDMEEEIRQETENEVEFHIAEEWAMDNEELFELKKSNMTVSNKRTDTPDGMNAVRKRPSTASKPNRPPRPQRCIIHPESTAKVSWDCLALIAILFDIYLGPLYVYNLDDQSAHVFEVLHWFASGYWLLDIPVSFCTAVYVNDLLHFQPGVIAKNYLSSWFCFDLLMLLPDIIHILQLDRLWSPGSAGSSTGCCASCACSAYFAWWVSSACCGWIAWPRSASASSCCCLCPVRA